MYKYNLTSHRVQHYQRHYQQTLGVKMASVRLTWLRQPIKSETWLRQLFFIYGFDKFEASRIVERMPKPVMSEDFAHVDVKWSNSEASRPFICYKFRGTLYGKFWGNWALKDGRPEAKCRLRSWSTNRHRGSVQRPWLADWYSRWRLWLSDVDTSCSSLDEQTSLTGSTGVDCQDTITSSHSCRLHTASSCTRSLTQRTQVFFKPQ